MERKGYIGGSDIGVILGLSQYKTPLQLWAEKTGMIEPDDISDKLQVALGVELEDFVAKRFAKETGKKVRRSPKIYQHKQHDWARCQVDRLIVGSDELLECKTTSDMLSKDWDGEEIPSCYICQVQWQLFVTGRKTGWIAVLIGNHKFLFKEIKEDKELQEMIFDKVSEFWKLVETDTAPKATEGDDETLVKLYPNSNEDLISIQSLEDEIARRQELKMHIDDMQKDLDLIDVKLKEVIADNSGIITEKYRVTWNTFTSKRVDADALKKAGLYDHYSKETTSRRFLVKLNKKDKNNA